MYETDIFVKFKFRFIGTQNFITNTAQIVITLSHTKTTQTYTRSVPMNFWRYLMSNTPPRFILLHVYMLQLSSQFVLSLPNFYLSEFSTPKEHRHDSYLDHGIIFCVRSLWNLSFSGNFTNGLSPFTVNHVMNVISTALLSRNYCLLQDHPLNCPFYPKINTNERLA
jgi:hypothetical protein